MSAFTRPLAAALGIAGMMVLAVCLPIGAAVAKDAEPEQAQQQPLKQIALTDKQVEAVIASKPEFDPIFEKMPEGMEEPDAKTMAQLDGVAKKHGFANFSEYDQVTTNINIVLDGFDPQSKKYVGPEAVLKQQIAELQADKKMAPKDKKEALAQLNEALKSVTPLQFPGNAQVVAKYYDKLSQLMSQDQQ